MIVVEITKVMRGVRLDTRHVEFAELSHALAWANEHYKDCKRARMYVDTKSRGTIQCGWIYRVKSNGQHWTSFNELVGPREVRSLDLKVAS